MRRLLLAGGGQASTPPPPVDPPPAPMVDMPAGYSPAFPASFAPTAVYEVGPTRTYQTVQAALTAAITRSNTDEWALVAVDPGTYTEAIPNSAKLSNRVVLAAAAGPGTVTMVGDNDHFAWSVGRFMVAGIAFEQAAPAAYCLHLQASGGDFGYFERCSFTAAGTTVGADVDNDGALIFRDCSFDAVSTAITCTNLHGWPSNTVPALVAYLDCTSTRGIGYNGNGGPIADALHVHGGTVDSVYAGDCTAHLDPGLTATLPGCVRVDSTEWPALPERGTYPPPP